MLCYAMSLILVLVLQGVKSAHGIWACVQHNLNSGCRQGELLSKAEEMIPFCFLFLFFFCFEKKHRNESESDSWIENV